MEGITLYNFVHTKYNRNTQRGKRYKSQKSQYYQRWHFHVARHTKEENQKVVQKREKLWHAMNEIIMYDRIHKRDKESNTTKNNNDDKQLEKRKKEAHMNLEK